MISKLGAFAYRISHRWIPDPFIFALLLTALTFVAGLVFSPQNNYQENGYWELAHSSARMLDYWSGGFWNLLSFGMQMCLILVLGGTLARSRPIENLINKLSRIPKTTGSAAALIAFTACLAALLNWGLGLIVGALLTRQVAIVAHRRNLKLHYPLLGAAGYTGLLVWHGGLSGSGPLALNSAGSSITKAVTGGAVVSLEHTLFSPLNLFVALTMLVLVPVICYLLAPKDTVKASSDIVEAPLEVINAEPDMVGSEKRDTPASKLETSRIITLLFGVTGLAIVFFDLFEAGFSPGFLSLDSVNWILLFTGLMLHKNARSYLRAVSLSAQSTGGVILQFPFYAGIMGMITQSGLVTIIAESMISFANDVTFPLLAFISAGLVNLFVPSGGGQVAVQGPIIAEASRLLGTDFNLSFMAMCYGDQWTNMLQPFWALPLLGLTGLKARDLLGYTIVIMLISGVAFVSILLIFSVL